MRRREENGKSENDSEAGERPQTESIDDHRCVLPLSRQLGPLVFRSYLLREAPQLVEDRLKDGVRPAATGSRRGRLHAFVTRPDSRRGLMVDARRRRSSAAVVVVDRMLR